MSQNDGEATTADSSNGQVFSRLDHQTLCKKLIESVEMIKELHQGNKVLRENVQAVQGLREKGDSENFHLQNENRDLRDRIEILESVIGAQSYDLNQDAWRDLLYPAGSSGPSESSVNLGKNT